MKGGERLQEEREGDEPGTRHKTEELHKWKGGGKKGRKEGTKQRISAKNGKERQEDEEGSTNST